MRDVGCSTTPPPPLPAGIAQLSLPRDARTLARIASGAISPGWGSYIYISYRQDLVQSRPTGTPRRSGAEVETALDGYVEFFELRAREAQAFPTPEDAAFEATKAWRDAHRLGR